MTKMKLTSFKEYLPILYEAGFTEEAEAIMNFVLKVIAVTANAVL